MSEDGKTVSIFDIARGAIGLLPDAHSRAYSLARLALLRPGSKYSLGLMFQRTAARHAERTFLKCGDDSWSYAKANGVVNQMARAFLAMGIQVGDVVGVLSLNRAETLLATIACAKIGAVAALFNTNQTGEVLIHSLNVVKPRLLLACDHGLERLNDLNAIDPQVVKGLEVLALESRPSRMPHSCFWSAWTAQSDQNLFQTHQIKADTACFYVFTSGTTGLPKASVMSHYRWLQAGSGMNAAVQLTHTDTLYCCLPLYHNNALTVCLGRVVASGACLALDEKFSVSRFWTRIEHYQATSFAYIGELLRYLMNQPETMNDQNHEVRLIVGNGLRPEIWRDFEARFGIEQIFEFYGASESNLGFMNAFGLRETVGFCPMPFEVIKVDPETEEIHRDNKGRCESVARGDVGLLISEVTSLRPFDGYTDSRANEKKLLRNVFKQGDCWFNSGDLVVLQKHGHIQFGDRIGDTFRWQGENVATTEVESVIMKWPEIEDAVVYGVTVPGRDGRCGMLYLTQKAAGQIDLDGLAAHMRENLPPYAVPRFIRIGQKVDVTGTFKFQKSKLKNAAYHVDEVDDELFLLARDAETVEALTADVQSKIDGGDIRL